MKFMYTAKNRRGLRLVVFHIVLCETSLGLFYLTKKLCVAFFPYVTENDLQDSESIINKSEVCT